MAKAVRGSIRMELRDADELSTAQIGLPLAMRRGVLQKAVRKAGRVMVPALRRATPKSKKKFGFQAEKNPPGTTRK